MAGDEAGTIGGEQDGRADYLVSLTEPRHRCAEKDLFSALGASKQVRIQLGRKNAGRNGVHADPLSGPLTSQAFRQR